MFSQLSKKLNYLSKMRSLNINKLNINLSYNHSIHKYSGNNIFTFCSKEKREESKKEDKSENVNEKQQSKEDKTHEEEVSIKKFRELKGHYSDLYNKAEIYKSKLDDLTRVLEESKSEKELIKNRLEKENLSSKNYAIAKFAKDILDVCDNFDRALKSISDSDFNLISDEEKKDLYSSFAEGVEMTQKSFGNTMRKHGVTHFTPTIGEKFDGSKHEANEIIEDSKKVFFKLFKEESETIDSVISPGYLINGKVIRTSKVLILLN